MVMFISILTLYNLINPALCNIYIIQILALFFVTRINDLYTGFGLVNRYIGYSQVVTTNNYNALKISITHKIKSSVSVYLVVAW
jgi:hypothetical protein